MRAVEKFSRGAAKEMAIPIPFAGREKEVNMFRRSLQFCSILILVVFVGVLSVRAQTLLTINTYQARIPFDFVVGNSTYQAGNYKLRLGRLVDPNMAALLSIENAAGDELYSSFVMRNGNVSNDDVSKLYFERYGNDDDPFILKQIVSPEYGYTVRSPKTKTSVLITKNFRERPETVAVALTRAR